MTLTRATECSRSRYASPMGRRPGRGYPAVIVHIWTSVAGGNGTLPSLSVKFVVPVVEAFSGIT